MREMDTRTESDIALAEHGTMGGIGHYQRVVRVKEVAAGESPSRLRRGFVTALNQYLHGMGINQGTRECHALAVGHVSGDESWGTPSLSISCAVTNAGSRACRARGVGAHLLLRAHAQSPCIDRLMGRANMPGDRWRCASVGHVPTPLETPTPARAGVGVPWRATPSAQMPPQVRLRRVVGSGRNVHGHFSGYSECRPPASQQAPEGNGPPMVARGLRPSRRPLETPMDQLPDQGGSRQRPPSGTIPPCCGMQAGMGSQNERRRMSRGCSPPAGVWTSRAKVQPRKRGCCHAK